MGRKKKVALPVTGDAFAFPLEDGRFGVCRVLSESAHREEPRFDAVMVACSAWIGSEVPSVDNPELRPILKLTHHSWKNSDEIGWIDDPLPDTFISIGKIEPTDEETSMECYTFCTWGTMGVQSLMQWRWDHERDAVLAEDAAQKEKQAALAVQNKNKHQKKLQQVKLQDLAKHTFFPNWEHLPKKTLKASRKIMTDTIKDLIALGESASEETRLEVLENCIESFNALNEEHEFIYTLEREDICDEFETIVHACGLGALDSPDEPLVDEWREW
ncbi:MAG: hypothetical protein KDA77_22875 [Planctomycetaceae bacterium]|nr:hypothetical protein [Planctomycetaceae bacterium]